MSTQYDSSILQEFADDLYARARWIVFFTALRYAVLAFIISAVGSQVMHTVARTSDDFTGVVVIITVLALAAGISAGRSKAFQLKLQAQQTLCQRQIEVNTRSTAEPIKVSAARA